MTDLLGSLPRRGRRGSKPRCHLLTHGSVDEVAARLTSLAAPFAQISSYDRWMPQGFADPNEAQLHNAPRLLDPEISALLRDWWLAPASQRAMTPNFDIASTCTIGGAPGMLLVEAKAHDEELTKETAGRRLTIDPCEDPEMFKDRMDSSDNISKAIASARNGLEEAISLPIRISLDSHYQMSNRFAWSWKLTELGLPVVLIYLGFLNATEMEDKGRPFSNQADWERLVKLHSNPLFPPELWDRQWSCNGRFFVPLIRSVKQPLHLE
jgi:hypothetical protein